jgi:hypothetical protein
VNRRSDPIRTGMGPTPCRPKRQLTSVSAGQPGCGAPRRNRTGDPILTMEPPGNRCAEPRFPSSRPTVGAKVIGSLSAKLCALSSHVVGSALEQAIPGQRRELSPPSVDHIRLVLGWASEAVMYPAPPDREVAFSTTAVSPVSVPSRAPVPERARPLSQPSPVTTQRNWRVPAPCRPITPSGGRWKQAARSRSSVVGLRGLRGRLLPARASGSARRGAPAG